MAVVNLVIRATEPPPPPGPDRVKNVRDRSAIMVCDVKFGAKILPVYSPLDIKV